LERRDLAIAKHVCNIDEHSAKTLAAADFLKPIVASGIDFAPVAEWAPSSPNYADSAIQQVKLPFTAAGGLAGSA